MTTRILAMVLLIAVAGCSQVDTAEWSEEVQLHDGSVVVIDARATLGRYGFPTAHRGGRISWELCFRSQKAYWKSSAAYKPVVFEIVNGKPYVVVPLGDCVECKLHDFPTFSALVYRWEGNGWKRAAPEELPATSTPNLLSNVWSASDSSRDASGHYTLGEKRKRDRDSDPVQRALVVERFKRQVRDTEKGMCPACKARGAEGMNLHGATAPDFEGRPTSDHWCQ